MSQLECKWNHANDHPGPVPTQENWQPPHAPEQTKVRFGAAMLCPPRVPTTNSLEDVLCIDEDFVVESAT